MAAIDYSADVVRAAFVKVEARVAAAEAASANGSIPALTLSAPVTALEGNSGTSSFVWTLNLTRNGSTAAVPYVWSVAGSGTNPANATDFGGTFPSGSGTFASGETSKTITVLVSGDTTVEQTETFTLTASGTLPLAAASSVGTITNDDNAPALNALTVTPNTATIGAAFSGTISGLTSGSSVALSGSGAAGLSISGAVINGTPTTAGPVDIVETLGGATYSPRTTSAAVTVAAATMPVFYTTSFDGTNGTDLAGFENWTQSGGTAGTLKITDGVLVQNNAMGAEVFTHAAGSGDSAVEASVCTLLQNGGRSPKYFYLRYTDSSNYIQMTVDQNNWSILKRVGGQNQPLKGYTGMTFDDGSKVKLQTKGNYCRVFYNGTEMADSAAANGGLGFDVADVPAVSRVALRFGNNTGIYPQKQLYDFTVYTVQ